MANLLTQVKGFEEDVDEYVRLSEQIKVLDAARKKIRARLSQDGRGRYLGTGKDVVYTTVTSNTIDMMRLRSLISSELIRRCTRSSRYTQLKVVNKLKDKPAPKGKKNAATKHFQKTASIAQRTGKGGAFHTSAKSIA
ncbi:hypothetical protein [Methylobacillus sp.]|uniref:hypothetical protein n=1 Tax=Methylobacillus sp. TaxID=56818 RepID=UPI0012CA4A8C|nr:hypothetical protein [Methylobacillus sp.]MPS48521.1 hypothetical protein [Methylobacillus sp.]